MENEKIIPEKKRGRKAKIESIITNELIEKTNLVKCPKKRGRKPKGGKVVICQPDLEHKHITVMNIILHLKCGLDDIKNSFDNNTEQKNTNYLENYKFSKTKVTNLNYMIYNNKINTIEDKINTIEDNINTVEDKNNTIEDKSDKSDDMKNIWSKLEKLSNDLHLNNICDKKSACFHCTYEFDNVPIYIPKHELNKTFHVYGCFCSPECACAFLMNEKNIDTTTKFERYHLLNYLYCKIYNYSKNIKPAPSPYYMLNKYYGNLSIQEYRKLLKNERLLLIVDKPLIRLLPELHEDTDNYLISYQGIPSSSYKYSLQHHDKQLSKNDILNEQFNLK